MKKLFIIIGLSLMIGMTTLAAPQKGWTKTDSETWQYINDDGTKATRWLQEGKNWYYLDVNGNMLTGWVQIDGSWYYLNGNGDMHTGWLQDSGKWYYLDSSGVMLVNTTTPDGYYVNSSGLWIENNNSTHMNERMLPEEQKLFDLLNEQMKQKIGKELEWDEIAYRAGKIVIKNKLEDTLWGGYEAYLREAGHSGYNAGWAEGADMTIERFVEKLVDANLNNHFVFNPSYTKMGVAYGEGVYYNRPYPYYIVFVY